MAEGYTYIENGIPIVNAEERPEVKKFKVHFWEGTAFDKKGFNEALTKWQKTLIPVKNAEIQLGIWGVPLESEHIKDFTPITPGQKVQHNEGEIIKII